MFFLPLSSCYLFCAHPLLPNAFCKPSFMTDHILPQNFSFIKNYFGRGRLAQKKNSHLLKLIFDGLAFDSAGWGVFCAQYYSACLCNINKDICLFEASCGSPFLCVKINNLNEDEDDMRYILHIQLNAYETHRTSNHAIHEVTQQESWAQCYQWKFMNFLS